MDTEWECTAGRAAADGWQHAALRAGLLKAKAVQGTSVAKVGAGWRKAGYMRSAGTSHWQSRNGQLQMTTSIGFTLQPCQHMADSLCVYFDQAPAEFESAILGW
jgi:hypothetical protein